MQESSLWNRNSFRLEITPVKVEITELEVEISEAVGAWLYNLVLSVMNTDLKTTLQRAIGNVLVESADHLARAVVVNAAVWLVDHCCMVCAGLAPTSNICDSKGRRARVSRAIFERVRTGQLVCPLATTAR